MSSLQGHVRKSLRSRIFKSLFRNSDADRALIVANDSSRQGPPQDWQFPKATLLVVGAHRTGSTLLCSLMAQTDRLGRPDEFFKRVPYPRWELVGNTVAERCRAVLKFGMSSNGVCGIKIFPYHMNAIQSEIALFDWFPQSRFVWIRRRDLLGQAISGVIATQTKKFHSYSEGVNREPEYSALGIARQLQRAAFDEARWRAYFARTGAQPHEIFYEDLVARPQAELSRLGQAADVQIDPAPISIDESGLEKQRSEINGIWRARYLAEQGDPNLIQLQFVDDL